MGTETGCKKELILIKRKTTYILIGKTCKYVITLRNLLERRERMLCGEGKYMVNYVDKK